MNFQRGWVWTVLIAFALSGGVVVETGCNIGGSDKKEAKDKKKSKKKKKKKKGSDGDDSGDDGEAPEGSVKLGADDFDWACAVHPEDKTSIHIPKGGEHAQDKEKEAAALARDLLRELTEPAGIPPGSIPPVFVEPAVGGSVASAVVFKKDNADYKKGQRVILFAPKEFVEHVKRSGTTDTIAFIFAHEMGHHVNGHLGNRPEQTDHSLELEADYYAGFLLGKRGTSLANATAWVRSNVPVDDTKSHPGRAKRLDAAARGWRKGCEGASGCDPNQTLPEGDTAPPEPTEEPKPKNPNLKSYSDRENR